MTRVHPRYTKENLDKLERNLSDVLKAEKDIEHTEDVIKTVRREIEFIKECRRTGKYPAIEKRDDGVTDYESGKSIFYKDDPTIEREGDGLYGSGKTCFIATAVYGNVEAPQVKALRKIRDEKLSKTKIGRKAIKFYYSGFGEKAAKYIQENFPLSVPVIRKGLDYLVKKYGN